MRDTWRSSGPDRSSHLNDAARSAQKPQDHGSWSKLALPMQKPTSATQPLAPLLPLSILVNCNLAGTCFTIAWMTMVKTTGYSPIMPGQWPTFLGYYAGLWAIQNLLRPLRIPLAIAMAPPFEGLMQRISESTGGYDTRPNGTAALLSYTHHERLHHAVDDQKESTYMLTPIQRPSIHTCNNKLPCRQTPWCMLVPTAVGQLRLTAYRAFLKDVVELLTLRVWPWVHMTVKLCCWHAGLKKRWAFGIMLGLVATCTISILGSALFLLGTSGALCMSATLHYMSCSKPVNHLHRIGCGYVKPAGCE